MQEAGQDTSYREDTGPYIRRESGSDERQYSKYVGYNAMPFNQSRKELLCLRNSIRVEDTHNDKAVCHLITISAKIESAGCEYMYTVLITIMCLESSNLWLSGLSL